MGPKECMPVSHLGHLCGAGLSWGSLWSGADIGISDREGRGRD